VLIARRERRKSWLWRAWDGLVAGARDFGVSDVVVWRVAFGDGREVAFDFFRRSDLVGIGALEGCF
jgi:hypothetical protein